MKKLNLIIYCTVLICISYSCKKETSEGKNSLIDLVVEPKGDNCPSGGYEINTGLDLNGNNILEAGEISESKYICNGNDGDNSITDFIPEPAGENCDAGGFKIITGIDADNNNVISENEITTTEYLCNGTNGSMNNDKWIRFVIAHYHIGTSSEEWYLSADPTYNFPDFNKNYFQNVDSIIFVPSLNTIDPYTKCIVELYNITDQVPIQNSLVESYSQGWNFSYSKNIYDYLPDKKIDLGMRIRSEKEGNFVSTGMVSYLYIYKH